MKFSALFLPLLLLASTLLALEGNALPYVSFFQDQYIPGLSYYYDGTQWQDFADLEKGGIFSLKGYTLVPKPSMLALITIVALFILLSSTHRRETTKPSLFSKP